MITESFVDAYNTRVTVRKLHDDDQHIQLLLTYADGSEQTSYGFTESDFLSISVMFSDLVDQLAL